MSKILIVVLIGYVLYKLASWFFRAGAAAEQLRNQQRGGAFNRNTNGNPAKDKRKNSGNNSGEYIDYEEVK